MNVSVLGVGVTHLYNSHTCPVLNDNKQTSKKRLTGFGRLDRRDISDMGWIDSWYLEIYFNIHLRLNLFKDNFQAWTTRRILVTEKPRAPLSPSCINFVVYCIPESAINLVFQQRWNTDFHAVKLSLKWTKRQ